MNAFKTIGSESFSNFVQTVPTFVKHKTIATPNIVNILILYVSTLSLSHLQKNATYFKKPTDRTLVWFFVLNSSSLSANCLVYPLWILQLAITIIDSFYILISKYM